LYFIISEGNKFPFCSNSVLTIIILVVCYLTQKS
jgi:hypothetical protein